MRRKLSLLIKIFHSTIRLPLISLCNFGKIKWKFSAAISIVSSVQASGASKLILGRRCEIEENTKICVRNGKVEIGDRVYINRNGTIVCHEGITIGDGTTIGPNVVIYDHDHDFRQGKNKFISSAITIGKNVWIGANVTILKGVTIADNAIIGAGCVITKNVPNNVVVVNNIEQRFIEVKMEVDDESRLNDPNFATWRSRTSNM